MCIHTNTHTYTYTPPPPLPPPPPPPPPPTTTTKPPPPTVRDLWHSVALLVHCKVAALAKYDLVGLYRLAVRAHCAVRLLIFKPALESTSYQGEV